MNIIFDIETDGLLDTLTKVHVVVIRDIDMGKPTAYCDRPGYPGIAEGLEVISKADRVVGHNVLKFDLQALEKVYGFRTDLTKVLDTLNISRLIWTDLAERDFKSIRQRRPFPGHLVGKHSLKAWGHRLGVLKGSFGGDEQSWAEWSPAMVDYCVQDVAVTAALWNLIQRKNYSRVAITLEHEFQRVMLEQERNGFLFDTKAAGTLYAELAASRQRMVEELQNVFPPKSEPMKVYAYWTDAEGKKYDTKSAAPRGTRGLTPGPFKLRVLPFNPGSRVQVAERLKEAHGWEPKEFTPSGQPKIDETTLESLAFPEAKLLAQFYMVEKRIGALAEGDKAWLKSVGKDGRIHGEVITNGAHTGRCAHVNPNMAQIPKHPAPYGKECRSLFIAPPGRLLVGADASGLELRVLAHFMAEFDGGEYVKLVTTGDVHTANQHSAGLATRNDAKTFIYAYCYGAGDWKLGSIRGVTKEELDEFSKDKASWAAAKKKLEKWDEVPVTPENIALVLQGRKLRSSFEKKLPALVEVQERAVSEWQQHGSIAGVDGRRLFIRSKNAILNTKVQSAGALAMKLATIKLANAIKTQGLPAILVANVHDEIQAEAAEAEAPKVGELAVRCIQEAGKSFRFRCPLDGEYKVGRSWHETH